MHIAEIIMLIVGAVLFTVSFFMPDKGGSSSKLDKEEEKRQINRLLEDQSGDAIQRINDAAEECVSDNRERMERAMERVSNEKIIAINEYSDTVLEEIKKNHDEVVFLYDMLNNKQSQIKNTAAELSQLTKSAKEAAAMETAAKEAAAKEAAAKGTAAKEATAKAVSAKEATKNGPVNGNASMAGSSFDESKGFGYVSNSENKGFGYVSNAENKGFGYVSMKSNPESGDKIFGYTASKNEENKEIPFETLPVTEISAEDSKVISDTSETNAPKKKTKKEVVKTPVADGSLDLMFASDNNSANNNDRILELHKAGKSNMAIAKELGLGIGEVKLVIDLFEGI